MIVFAGFEKGVRKNTIIMFEFETNEWSEINIDEKAV